MSDTALMHIAEQTSVFARVSTFFIMLQVFRAPAPLFHTGWFVESLATQMLVLFIIRTAGNPLRRSALRRCPACTSSSWPA